MIKKSIPSFQKLPSYKFAILQALNLYVLSKYMYVIIKQFTLIKCNVLQLNFSFKYPINMCGCPYNLKV